MFGDESLYKQKRMKRTLQESELPEKKKPKFWQLWTPLECHHFPYPILVSELDDFIKSHWFVCWNKGHFFKGLTSKICPCPTEPKKDTILSFEHADGCITWDDYCFPTGGGIAYRNTSNPDSLIALSRMVFQDGLNFFLLPRCKKCGGVGDCIDDQCKGKYEVDTNKISAACHIYQKEISRNFPLTQEMFNMIHYYFFHMFQLTK